MTSLASVVVEQDVAVVVVSDGTQLAVMLNDEVVEVTVQPQPAHPVTLTHETLAVTLESETATVEVTPTAPALTTVVGVQGPLGQPGQSAHTNLTERDAPESHPVAAITGLAAALNDIETLALVGI